MHKNVHIVSHGMICVAAKNLLKFMDENCIEIQYGEKSPLSEIPFIEIVFYCGFDVSRVRVVRSWCIAKITFWQIDFNFYGYTIMFAMDLTIFSNIFQMCRVHTSAHTNTFQLKKIAKT